MPEKRLTALIVTVDLQTRASEEYTADRLDG
jgi:hypothetical protein